MLTIRLDDQILFLCIDCQKRFWESGDKKPGEIKCPHCGSINHQIVTTKTN